MENPDDERFLEGLVEADPEMAPLLKYATVYCESCGKELTYEEQVEIATNNLQWMCPECRRRRIYEQ